MLHFKHLDLTDRERVFLIGDIHGQHKLFHEFLDWKDVTEKDHVIAVGDLVDRGTGNIELLTDFLISPNMDSTFGNHEDFMVKATLEGGIAFPTWLQNGGAWSLDVRNDLLKGFCNKVANEFPVFLSFDFAGQTNMVCHAEFPFESRNAFMHSLDLFTKAMAGNVENGTDLGILVDWESNVQQALWGRAKVRGMTNASLGGVPGFDNVFHGHTPTQIVRKDEEPKVITIANQHWIDTGSCFKGGRQTIIELQADGTREVHQLWFDEDGELCIV